jgi:hypothetical protein
MLDGVRWWRKRPKGPRIQDSKRRPKSMAVPAATVLVASYLVINAPSSAHAAPQPVRTSSPKYPVSCSYSRTDSRASGARHHYNSGVDDYVYDSGDEDENMRITFSTQGTGLHFDDSPTRPTSTHLARRAGVDDINLSRASASGPITVPPSFASNIASSWDPGKRSIWFQRKAVIITSIFLAIFIVLIMGCAVFLRDKRDDDQDVDYDESDEAALEWMRQEREERQRRKQEKPRGKRVKKSGRGGDDGGSIASERVSEKDGAKLSTTAIIASRWSKNPVRRIRLRRNKSKATVSSTQGRGSSTTEAVGMTSRSETQSSSEAVHDITGEANDSPVNSSTLVASTGQSAGTRSTTSIDRSAPTNENPLSYAETVSRSGGASAPGAQSDARSLHSRSRQPLTEQDIAAADCEASRSAAETMPPAYRPDNAQQTPARRRLAGEEEDEAAQREQEHQRAVQEARGDNKVMPPEETEEEGQQSSAFAGAATRGGQTVGSESRDVPTSDSEAIASGSVPSANALSGHIATDEKTALSQMRAAASQPEAAPQYVPSAPISSGLDTPSAPISTTSPYAPAFDDNRDEQAAIVASKASYRGDAVPTDSKGKGSRAAAAYPAPSRLPAPPPAHYEAHFSRFDMPYALERPSSRSSVPRVSGAPASSSQPSSESTQRQNDKQREADEEERRALTVMASQPGEGRDLPRYRESADLRPSAPAFEPEQDGERDVQLGNGEPTTSPRQHADSTASPASAPSVPSAPPLPDDDDSH